MKIIVTAALAKNRVIGIEGRLPWYLPTDLKRFRQRTMGCPVIMGRRTFESFKRPLDGRLNIVLSRTRRMGFGNTEMVTNMTKALDVAAAARAERCFIIGGADIFNQGLGLADELDLTMIDQSVAGDTLFPAIGEEWNQHSLDGGPRSENGFSFQFITLTKA